MVTDNLVHVTYVFAIPGPKRATINLDYGIVPDATAADLSDMCDAAVDDWNTSTGFKSVVSTVNSLVQVEAFSYHLVAHTPTPSDPRLYQREIDIERRIKTSGVAGTLAGTALPPQNSVGVTFRTDQASRRARGRVYLPATVEAVVDEKGFIEVSHRATLLARFETALDAIASAPATADAEQVVVSLMGGTAFPVTTREIRARIDTQRRRLSRTLDV